MMVSLLRDLSDIGTIVGGNAAETKVMYTPDRHNIKVHLSIYLISSLSIQICEIMLFLLTSLCYV